MHVPKRFNVAISRYRSTIATSFLTCLIHTITDMTFCRARSLLVIVGNPYLLIEDEHWKKLIEYCLQHNAYKGCEIAPLLEADAAVRVCKSVAEIWKESDNIIASEWATLGAEVSSGDLNSHFTGTPFRLHH